MYICDWSSDVCSSDLNSLRLKLPLSSCRRLFTPSVRKAAPAPAPSSAKPQSFAELAAAQASANKDKWECCTLMWEPNEKCGCCEATNPNGGGEKADGAGKATPAPQFSFSGAGVQAPAGGTQFSFSGAAKADDAGKTTPAPQFSFSGASAQAPASNPPFVFHF